MKRLFLFLLITVTNLANAQSCHAGEWSAAKQHWLAQVAGQQQNRLLQGYSSYHYPFGRPLRLALERKGESTVPLLVYGSLLNYDSAIATLDGKTLADMRPAVAFSIRRLFNRDVSKSRGYGEPATPEGRGMLNVKQTWSTYDMVNGVLIHVPIEEVRALCEREYGYNLIPVVTVMWDSALDSTCQTPPDFFVSYVLHAHGKSNSGKPLTNSDITPFHGYYEAVKEGASSYGPAFFNLYMDTTYLADGKTKIGSWEQQNSTQKSD